jgi:hypothetical protein
MADVFGPKKYAGEKIDDEFTAFHPDTGTLGIPRAEMPQIKQEDIAARSSTSPKRAASPTKRTRFQPTA